MEEGYSDMAFMSLRYIDLAPSSNTRWLCDSEANRHGINLGNPLARLS